MDNIDMIPLIRDYQQGDVESFYPLYDEFEQLLHYYGRHLNYDDALQELTVYFVELITEISLHRFCADETVSLQKYIAVCIRNKYIALSKQKQRHDKILVEYREYIASSQPPFEDRLALSAALRRLTEKQYRIILYKYVYGYSDVEISSSLNISRQAVNRLKTRGLHVLRESMKED